MVHHQTVFGWLALDIQDQYLHGVSWMERPTHIRRQEAVSMYVDSILQGLHLPCPWNMVVVGTSFQRKVWHAIGTIPFGETKTYSEVARMVGYARAAQAVGQACKKNPFPLIVPCHRVVPKGLGDGGYCGVSNSARKSELLRYENCPSNYLGLW